MNNDDFDNTFNRVAKAGGVIAAFIAMVYLVLFAALVMGVIWLAKVVF
jgi:hypothetical protein